MRLRLSMCAAPVSLLGPTSFVSNASSPARADTDSAEGVKLTRDEAIRTAHEWFEDNRNEHRRLH